MASKQPFNTYSSISQMISAKVLGNQANKLIKMLHQQLVDAINYNVTMEQVNNHLQEIIEILTYIIGDQNLVQNRNILENLEKLKVQENKFKEDNTKLNELKMHFNPDIKEIELTIANINKLIEIMNDKTEEPVMNEENEGVASENPNHQDLTTSNEDQVMRNETTQTDGINNNDSANSVDVEMGEVIVLGDDDDVIVLDGKVDEVVDQEQIKTPRRNSPRNKQKYDHKEWIGILNEGNEQVRLQSRIDEGYNHQAEVSQNDQVVQVKNEVKNEPRTILSLNRGKYNPNIHCGVKVNNSPCKCSLTCAKHTRDQKRKVHGRNKPFDELLKSSSQINHVSKRKYDPDKHCGVLVNGQPCKYGLQCKLHWIGERKLVEGRSKPIMELLINSNRTMTRKYDPDKHCGVLVNGSPCKRSIVCHYHSFKQKNMVQGRSKTLYKLLCEHNAHAS